MYDKVGIYQSAVKNQQRFKYIPITLCPVHCKTECRRLNFRKY